MPHFVVFDEESAADRIGIENHVAGADFERHLLHLDPEPEFVGGFRQQRGIAPRHGVALLFGRVEAVDRNQPELAFAFSIVTDHNQSVAAPEYGVSFARHQVDRPLCGIRRSDRE